MANHKKADIDKLIGACGSVHVWAKEELEIESVICGRNVASILGGIVDEWAKMRQQTRYQSGEQLQRVTTETDVIKVIEDEGRVLVISAGLGMLAVPPSLNHFGVGPMMVPLAVAQKVSASGRVSKVREEGEDGWYKMGFRGGQKGYFGKKRVERVEEETVAGASSKEQSNV